MADSSDVSETPRYPPEDEVALSTIAREWTRIGVIGFGGPPAHIKLLRKLCVEDREWLSPDEFEDGIAAVNILPGPASTQLAIFCAWRLRGTIGALLGATCFILPGLVLILGLSALFLGSHPPLGIAGAAAGAGAAVPAVALNAAAGLMGSSWRRTGRAKTPRAVRDTRARWVAYVAAGGAAAAVPAVGPLLVIVLISCGLIEVGLHLRVAGDVPRPPIPMLVPWLAVTLGASGFGALIWVAFKVGALAFGGGFVIIPLMQHDAVSTYHWLSKAQFLNAVALGQVTPGPVVLTVAAVGYAAKGLVGGLLATVVASAPSCLFVIVGARHFDRLRSNAGASEFLAGAGAAAIGAIAGASIQLTLALGHLWQFGVLGLAAIWLLALRKGVVVALLAAGLLGVVAALAGAPV